MAAIRQEDGPAVRALLGLIASGYGSTRSAGCGHSKEPASRVWRKEDHAILIPRATSGIGHIAQWARRSAGHCNYFELALSKKTERSAVWRPERKRSAIGSR